MTPARRRDRGGAGQGRLNGRGITRSARALEEDRGNPSSRRSFPCSAGGAAPLLEPQSVHIAALQEQVAGLSAPASWAGDRPAAERLSREISAPRLDRLVA